MDNPVGQICIIVAGFLVLLCGSGLARGAADEPEPVRIALTREPSAAPLFIAVAEGFFKAEGLDPQITFLESDAAVSAAVASGTVDIGMASVSAPFYRYAAAHSLKLIASRSSDQSGLPMYALLSSSTRAADHSGVRALTDARIGIADTESGAYYALFKIASRFGLDPGSIKTVSLRSTAGELETLSRGNIDAALLPFAIAINAKSGRSSLLRLSDFAQWQQGVVFTTAENIATRRSLIQRFVRAYQHGTEDYQLNFLHYDDGGDFIPGPQYDKYLKLIARQARMSPETLAKTKTYCDRRGNLDVTDIEKQVQFWQAQGRLDKHIAATGLLDISFIGEETSPATRALVPDSTFRIK